MPSTESHELAAKLHAVTTCLLTQAQRAPDSWTDVKSFASDLAALLSNVDSLDDSDADTFAERWGSEIVKDAKLEYGIECRMELEVPPEDSDELLKLVERLLRRAENVGSGEDVSEKAWALSDHVRELLREVSEVEVEERAKKVEGARDELQKKVRDLQKAFKEYDSKEGVPCHG